MMHTYQTNVEINVTQFTAVKQYFSEKTAPRSTTVVMLLANLKKLQGTNHQSRKEEIMQGPKN
jgi:hypothetical protein